MASSGKRSLPNRFFRFLLSHRGGLVMGLIKALVVFVLFVMVLDFLLSKNATPAEHLTALFVITLLAISLAYLLIVSSQILLDIPGIDDRALESGDEKVSEDTEGVWLNKEEKKRSKIPWRRKRQGIVGTIQVSRLSTEAAHIFVANRSRLPVLRAQTALVISREVEGEDAASDGGTKLIRGKVFSIPARSSRQATIASAFNHVGIFRMNSAGIRVWDIVGLLSRIRGMCGQWRVRVVPNIYRLTRGIPDDRKVSQSSLGVPDTPADALDYDRVRDYQPGDPLKTIHWKIVAHSNGELYTKLFETSTITGVTLLIDPFGPSVTSDSSEAAFHMHDTMLEGAFSLVEFARNSGIAVKLRFVNRGGSFVETSWQGQASLGWFVETARRPTQTQQALERSMSSIQSLRDARTGYAIVATSSLSEGSVRELIECHHAGVPLLVVHALPSSQSDRARQRSLDARLRMESIHVIELLDGSQIVREVSA